ncbi:hypothetical protein BaRGS_00032594 [Batillaria attramentaria]|uniref:Formyl transferase C-terminal domain-containing protein n=1 Tax=Batillaria attramentaria TaxID=370345 RepID=A0ABD0JNC7_9CAEN
MPLKTEWNDQPVKLLNMVTDVKEGFEPSALRGTSSGQDGAAGMVVYDRRLQAICVKCRRGWACFQSIVLKKTMSAADFHNGYLSKDKHKGVHFQSAHNGLFGPEYWDFVSRPKAKS